MLTIRNNAKYSMQQFSHKCASFCGLGILFGGICRNTPTYKLHAKLIQKKSQKHFHRVKVAGLHAKKAAFEY